MNKIDSERRDKIYLSKSGEFGFSLIELIIVFGLIGLLSVLLVSNFRGSSTTATARRQTSSVFIADVRRAQSLAVSGANFAGNIVCGYGISYLNQTSYIIYAKSKPGGSSCSSIANRNYVSSDLVVETIKILNPSMMITSNFGSIYFQPPDPKVYINNSNDPAASTSVSVCAASNCSSVNIYTSGRIDLIN